MMRDFMRRLYTYTVGAKTVREVRDAHRHAHQNVNNRVPIKVRQMRRLREEVVIK